jgi:hypothetical protein
MARADRTVAEDMVFVPFAFVEAAANVLTNPALDPYGKIPEFKFAAVRVLRRAGCKTGARLAPRFKSVQRLKTMQKPKSGAVMRPLADRRLARPAISVALPGFAKGFLARLAGLAHRCRHGRGGPPPPPPLRLRAAMNVPGRPDHRPKARRPQQPA